MYFMQGEHTKNLELACDEQKPHCERCQKRRVLCHYPSESDGFLNKSTEKSVAISLTPSDPSTTCFSFSLDNVMNNVERTLSLDPKWSPYAFTEPGSTHPISSIAFQHFVRCSTETIAQPVIQDVMRTDMIRVSFTVTFPKITFELTTSC
ncbi:uncharacterized protein N7477_001356 [Penicillium maclennaniae]|uniref:uncharacterized protein n=1 Tax=Penicillium maclennaniae TaxID=1343394 RepID=UPI002540CB2F|nr:uncharacterized protein N7477_001356 [Penicillium maclennaniae]KAJ5681416.1 hypothetical protein N7477_001356 [Penicillium maclennaniae]